MKQAWSTEYKRVLINYLCLPAVGRRVPRLRGSKKYLLPLMIEIQYIN